MPQTPYSGSLSLRLLPLRELTKRHIAHSSAHSSIGTLSRILLPAPTPCKRMVSEIISAPSRDTFKLSITVLVHYRSGRVFSLGTSSCLLPTRLLGSRCTMDLEHVGEYIFAYRTITVFGSTFQWIQLIYPSHIVSLGGHTFRPNNPLLMMTQVRPNARGKTCVSLGAKVTQ